MREIRMLRTTWRKLETGLRDGLRHRKMAKASGQLRLPDPVATAPAFDPTLTHFTRARIRADHSRRRFPHRQGENLLAVVSNGLHCHRLSGLPRK